MKIRLYKNSSVQWILEDGTRFGAEAKKSSATGFYHILSWMIHTMLLSDGQEAFDLIVKEQQEKIRLLREIS